MTKGTMAAAGAIVSWLMGQYGYGDLAGRLTDPAFLQSIFNWIAMGLTLYAGVAQGVKPKVAIPVAGDTSVSLEALQDLVQPDLSDPYPGWDWDPLKGWVKING
jgi:hypothetical protein